MLVKDLSIRQLNALNTWTSAYAAAYTIGRTPAESQKFADSAVESLGLWEAYSSCAY